MAAEGCGDPRYGLSPQKGGTIIPPAVPQEPEGRQRCCPRLAAGCSRTSARPCGGAARHCFAERRGAGERERQRAARGAGREPSEERHGPRGRGRKIQGRAWRDGEMPQEKGEEPAASGARNSGVKEQDRSERGGGAEQGDGRDPERVWGAGEIRVGGWTQGWRPEKSGHWTRVEARPGVEAGDSGCWTRWRLGKVEARVGGRTRAEARKTGGQARLEAGESGGRGGTLRWGGGWTVGSGRKIGDWDRRLGQVVAGPGVEARKAEARTGGW